MPHTRILSVATELAPNRLDIDTIADRVLDASPTKLPVGYINRLTGVRTVYHRHPWQQASDLAAAAATTALERAGLTIHDIDLLLFASASQDLIEPATSHIVSDLLGGRYIPVFDVKNACNSFLGGLHMADVFIRSGQYHRVLVVSGETPSMAIRWACNDKSQFTRAIPGFSMTDGGAAMVVAADSSNSIHRIAFRSDSSQWDAGTLGAGGSRAPRELDATYFDMDGRKLHDAFLSLGPSILQETLEETGKDWDDFAAIGMHQVSLPYLANICHMLGVPQGRLVNTIAHYGNVTSLSLPLQLELAMGAGTLRPGDDFAFIGFAGGISTGLGVFTV